MASEAQIIGGHKANLHNPNTSAEAKEHSKEVLKEDFNGKNRHPSRQTNIQPLHSLICIFSMLTCPPSVIVDGNKTKDLSHVEAGLKGYVLDASY